MNSYTREIGGGADELDKAKKKSRGYRESRRERFDWGSSGSIVRTAPSRLHDPSVVQLIRTERTRHPEIGRSQLATPNDLSTQASKLVVQ